MIEQSTTVLVKEGLHTRPAAQLAKFLKRYSSSVELVSKGKQANAKSSVKVMLLGVKEGEQVVFRTDGEDEGAASDFVLKFLTDPEAGMDIAEDAAPHGAAEKSSSQVTGLVEPLKHIGIRGIIGSRGVAMGKAHIYVPQKLVAHRQVIGEQEIPAELNRFRKALADLEQRFLSDSSGHDEGAHSDQKRAILQALLDVAQDEEYVGAIIRGIEDRGDAAAVTLRVGAVLASTFEALTDEYMRARAEDIRGVTRQLAAQLLGQTLPDLEGISETCVLVANDLSAWEFSKVPMEHVVGLVCIGGSATSHVAIMARTYGKPALLGVPLAETDLTRIESLIVDGDGGQIIINPTQEESAHYEALIVAEQARHAELEQYKDLVPVTRDGRRVEIAANLGSLGEVALAKKAGAMGVGLFRTELLFMQRSSLPNEDEQCDVYTKLADEFHPLPVIIRTLDVGGDKPVAGIDFPKEENPFLGWRGVRMCLDRLDIFKPQLRALLRAACLGNLKVMVPMISDVSEVTRVRELIEECAAELTKEGIPHEKFELGIMIETPAAVLHADALAAEVAFFSIGTNDLTQYVMATDRANAQIASLYRTEHPAVMKAIELTCQAAAKAGIWVGICGEAAANPALIPTFVNMGVAELSMSPAAILASKKLVSEV